MRKRNRKNNGRRILHAFNYFNNLYWIIWYFNCCLIFLINNYLFDICWGRVNIDLVYSFSYIYNHLWLSWPLSHGTIDYVTTTLDPVEATSTCKGGLTNGPNFNFYCNNLNGWWWSYLAWIHCGRRNYTWKLKRQPFLAMFF